MQRGGLAMTRSAMTAAATSRLPEYSAQVEHIAIPSTLGPVNATIYRAEGSDTNPPVYINLHGGGYVMDLTGMDDPACRAIAVQSGAVVVNVDYVVAPQHQFPAPPNQVYEVLQWVAANGASHGWDGSRIAIGGQSAGGSLAAAAARLAFEQGTPSIALQVLHYPPLDLSVPARSKHSPLSKPVLRPWMGEVFDAAYAPDPVTRSDRLISPAGEADTVDLTGIAPAVVIAAENDILHDEARRYADRLERARALVAYHEVAGADHGYDIDNDELARTSYAMIAGHIRSATAASANRAAGPTDN
jgi:acetyl esterase